jgi:hypothetical protein
MSYLSCRYDYKAEGTISYADQIIYLRDNPYPTAEYDQSLSSLCNLSCDSRPDTCTRLLEELICVDDATGPPRLSTTPI